MTEALKISRSRSYSTTDSSSTSSGGAGGASSAGRASGSDGAAAIHRPSKRDWKNYRNRTTRIEKGQKIPGLLKKGAKAAGALAPPVSVAWTVLEYAAGAFINVKAKRSSEAHRTRLMQLTSKKRHCTCGKCPLHLQYAQEQKRKKAKRRGRKAFAPPLEGGRAAARGAQKRFHKTKGVERENRAKQLIKSGRRGGRSDGCPCALAIIAELLGDYRPMKYQVWASSLVEYEENWVILFAKLSST